MNNPLRYTDVTGDTLDIQGSQKFINQVYEAINYLEDNGVAGVLEYLQNHEETIIIKEGTRLDDFDYSSSTNTIRFNPYSALEVIDNNGNKTGGVQTPALGLLHEAGHAQNDVNNTLDRTPRFFDLYSNNEEYNVITNVETPAAKVLNEPIRSNHLGATRRTSCSTCTRKATFWDKIKNTNLGWWK